MIQMDTHQNLQYKYPQAPSFAQGPKILATATQKNTNYTPRLGL